MIKRVEEGGRKRGRGGRGRKGLRTLSVAGLGDELRQVGGGGSGEGVARGARRGRPAVLMSPCMRVGGRGLAMLRGRGGTCALLPLLVRGRGGGGLVDELQRVRGDLERVPAAGRARGRRPARRHDDG